jgi:serine/threonine protein kinase
MKALKKSLDRLQFLIEHNELEQVFKELRPLVHYNEYRVSVSLLFSDFNDLKKEAMELAITKEEERVRQLQIKRSLLQLLNHIRNTEEGEVAEDEDELVQITLAKTEAEFQRLLEDKLSTRYRDIERLSSGDNAIIYKAKQIDEVTGTSRTVAIKVIKPLSVIDDENLENIREDLSKAKQLSGLDGIISILDEGLDAPPRYIVTEFVDGMRLSDRLKKGWPYQLREIKEMLYTMARALAQGHADGLVHNNLWPSNILIDKKKGPRLSPFQVVRASFVKRTFERIRLFSMYWSPEQINTDRATHLSDQFSFGLIAFELFANEPFFRGGTILDILRKRLAFDEQPELLEEELKDTLCPPNFVRAIRKMLSPEPEDRFLGMEDVIEEIQAIPSGSEPVEKHPEYPLVRKLRYAYNRCRRVEGFYNAFYDHFLERAPHAREVFDRAWTARMNKYGYTEERIWRYQHRMLDLAMERLLQFPSVSTAMGQQLQRLAKRHDAVGVNPEDYALFLTCVKDTIWEFDKEYWPDKAELDRAWELVISSSLKTLQQG